jgi:hypothetical protein
MDPNDVIQEETENLLAEDIAFCNNKKMDHNRDSSISGNCNLDLTQGPSVIGKTANHILSDPYQIKINSNNDIKFLTNLNRQESDNDTKEKP